jgi:hypothetical protein
MLCYHDESCMQHERTQLLVFMTVSAVASASAPAMPACTGGSGDYSCLNRPPTAVAYPPPDNTGLTQNKDYEYSPVDNPAVKCEFHCANNYTWDPGSNSCIANQAGPACGNPVAPTPTANPTRVAQGGTTQLSWSGGANATTCTLARTDTTDSHNVPGAASCNNDGIPSGGPVTSKTITTQTTYCITCTNGTSTDKKCVTVNVVPGYVEY